MKKINEILKDVLEKVNPSEDLEMINNFLKKFISEFEKKLKEKKLTAEVFVGGSFAKKTLIKKGRYDVDVFVRYDQKYGKDISKWTEKILEDIRQNFITIHGSRDYFKIETKENFFLEIIPVIKVKNPKEAENITDLSYFHVGYVKRKLKTEKMLEEVRLAKAFCHANKCYGAESYINGFSGYALELLVYHYKGFLNFLKAMTKIKNCEIIDIEKMYKNKMEIKMNMNGAKMNSPIVLIDPTYKERNALAALSNETFSEFQKVCMKFIKKPSEGFFEEEKIDFEKLRESSRKRKEELALITAETDKQEGDVAGSKLVKFYRHMADEISKFYKISYRNFDYGGKKEANYIFTAKSKGEILIEGPNKNDKENSISFREKHKNTFVKGNKIYARDKIKNNLKEFLENWKLKNQGKIREMGITEIKIN